MNVSGVWTTLLSHGTPAADPKANNHYSRFSRVVTVVVQHCSSFRVLNCGGVCGERSRREESRLRRTGIG